LRTARRRAIAEFLALLRRLDTHSPKNNQR